MTAEVAILNRGAVALATDSAVTIGQKTYTTENKLFELSRTKPIGLMIYNSLDFYNYPWEVLIKDFRTANGDKSHSYVSDWAQTFVDWLYNNRKPTVKLQDEYFRKVVEEILREAYHKYLEQIAPLRTKNSRSNSKSIKPILGNVLRDLSEEFAGLRSASRLEKLSGLKAVHAPLLDETTLRAYIDTHGKVISDLAKEQFLGPLDEEEQALVRNLIFDVLARHRPTSFSTGLVFAGFGEKNEFPALHHLTIDGLFSDQLRCFETQYYSVGQSGAEQGTVLSFAQPNVTRHFLYGVDEALDKRIAAHFAEEIKDLKTEIGLKLNLGSKRLKVLREALEQGADTILQRYNAKAGADLKKEAFADTEEMVALMPKQEMADLAEALVNITIIKGKASSDQETVGGPVDVAIISRHEGFVWIKRKHYFDPKYNARYFWRQFGQWPPVGAKAQNAPRAKDDPL
ncbi:MAG TPA: hypothetical protein VGF53_08045 [Pseudolabrys sp.]